MERARRLDSIGAVGISFHHGARTLSDFFIHVYMPDAKHVRIMVMENYLVLFSLHVAPGGEERENKLFFTNSLLDLVKIWF